MDITVFDAQIVLPLVHGSPFRLATMHHTLTTLKVDLTVLSNLTTFPKQTKTTHQHHENLKHTLNFSFSPCHVPFLHRERRAVYDMALLTLIL